MSLAFLAWARSPVQPPPASDVRGRNAECVAQKEGVITMSERNKRVTRRVLVELFDKGNLDAAD